MGRIADKYKNGSDVKDDIKYFNNKLNNTEFKIYEKATISLKSAINVPEILSEDVYTDCDGSVCKGSIYENYVDIEKENFENEVQKWENRIKLNKIPFLPKIVGTMYQWGSPDAIGMINIASGKYLPIYTKDAIKIKNIFDENFENFNKGDLLKWQLCMADKISEQFTDYNYDLDNIKGYIFKKNSAVVKRIKKSEEFKNILSKHISSIKSKNKFSDKYVTDENLHSAFGSVDFFIGGLDKNGNLHLYMFDTYDFNKNETSPAVEAGRRQMLNGNLKGFFSIHEIVITKKELKKYGLQDIG